MWLERTVMFPTLHSTIKDVLDANDQTKVQFILEPLAFPQILLSFKAHGQGFIEQLSYLTRTFAFYIHRDYQKLIKQLQETPPHPNNPVINVTYSVSIPGMSEDLPPPSSLADTTCRQPDTQACTSLPHQRSRGQQQPGSHSTEQAELTRSQTCIDTDMPGKVKKVSHESVCLSLPSFPPVITMSDPTPAQTCSATLQQSDSGRAVQKLSQCQILDCQGLGHVDNSEVGEGHHLHDNL